MITDSAKPLVSIIMPVYNGEKYIAEAIRSVIAQTYHHWELIIVNDGSKDRSTEMVKSFTDERIYLLQQENKGVSAARNAGLRRMKGEYFCFLDADDVYPPDSIQSRLTVFNKSESIAFVDGAIETYDHTLTNVLRFRKPDFEGHPFSELVKLRASVFFGPTWLIRRQPGFAYAYEETLTHAEDIWFCFQISREGIFAYTNEVILKYRSNPHSAMRNLDGLANGYTRLTQLLFDQFKSQLTVDQKLMWVLKVRKIMFLSFLAKGYVAKAARYLLIGR